MTQLTKDPDTLIAIIEEFEKELGDVKKSIIELKSSGELDEERFAQIFDDSIDDLSAYFDTASLMLRAGFRQKRREITKSFEEFFFKLEEAGLSMVEQFSGMIGRII